MGLIILRSVSKATKHKHNKQNWNVLDVIELVLNIFVHNCAKTLRIWEEE